MVVTMTMCISNSKKITWSMTSMIRRRPLAVITWLVRQYSSSATRQFVRRPSWRCARRGGHVSDICTLPSVTRCRSTWPMATMTTRTSSATTTTSAIYRTSWERHRTQDSWSATKVKMYFGRMENLKIFARLVQSCHRVRFLRNLPNVGNSHNHNFTA